MRIGVISMNTVCNIAVFEDNLLKYFCTINLDKSSLSKIYCKFKELKVEAIKIITLGDLLEEGEMSKNCLSIGSFSFGSSINKISCISREDLDSIELLADSLNISKEYVDIYSMFSYYCNASVSGGESIICDYFGSCMYRCYHIKDFRILSDRIFNTGTCEDILPKFLNGKTCPVLVGGIIDPSYMSKIKGVSNLNCFNYSNLGPIVYCMCSNIGLVKLSSLVAGSSIRSSMNSESEIVDDIVENVENPVKKKKLKNSLRNALLEDDEDDEDDSEEEFESPKKHRRKMKFDLSDDDEDNDNYSVIDEPITNKAKLKVSPVTKKIKKIEKEERVSKFGKFFGYGIFLLILMGSSCLVLPNYVNNKILLCQHDNNVTEQNIKNINLSSDIYSTNLSGNYMKNYSDFYKNVTSLDKVKSYDLGFCGKSFNTVALFENATVANKALDKLKEFYPNSFHKIEEYYTENNECLSSLTFNVEF